MNWFAVAAGAGMLLVAINGYRRAQMTKAQASLTALAGLIFLAIGSRLV